MPDARDNRVEVEKEAEKEARKEASRTGVGVAEEQPTRRTFLELLLPKVSLARRR